MGTWTKVVEGLRCGCCLFVCLFKFLPGLVFMYVSKTAIFDIQTCPALIFFFCLQVTHYWSSSEMCQIEVCAPGIAPDAGIAQATSKGEVVLAGQ